MTFIKRWGDLILLLLALILAFTPLLMRTAIDNPLIPGAESYYHIRLAHALEENPFMKVDLLQERSYAFNLYHYFLLILLKLGVSDQMLIISSILVSLATAYFFYESLRKLVPRNKKFIAVMIYLFSPFYILTANTTTPYTLAALILSISFYLYISGKYKYASRIVPSLLILIEPLTLLVYLFILIVYSHKFEKKYSEVLQTFIYAILLGLIFKTIFNVVPLIKFSGGTGFSNYITDFGAIAGYPFFTLLLALVAVALFWKKYKIQGLTLLLVGAFSTIAPGSMIVINALICVCAAFVLEFFIKRKWAIPILRDLTLLLIISSLLFSAVSFTTRLTVMEPTPGSIVAFEDIKKSNWNGFVLAKPELGFLVEYYTLRPAFLDDYSVFYSDYQKRTNAAEIMLESKSPNRVKSLMNQNKITFVYTTPDMEKSLNYKGILVVTEVSENFIKIAEFEGRKAWLYIKSEEY